VLDRVPWDQALDIVLRNNGLGKALEGNVLRIAKIDTLIAEQEAARRLAAGREEAEPLVTVFRPLSYAKVKPVAELFKNWAGGGGLSKRGTVLVDERNNTLIVSDISSQIPIIDSILAKLDKRSKQVSIEAAHQRKHQLWLLARDCRGDTRSERSEAHPEAERRAAYQHQLSDSGDHLFVAQHVGAMLHETLVFHQPQRPLRPGISRRDGPAAIGNRMCGIGDVTVEGAPCLGRRVK